MNQVAAAVGIVFVRSPRVVKRLVPANNTIGRPRFLEENTSTYYHFEVFVFARPRKTRYPPGEGGIRRWFVTSTRLLRCRIDTSPSERLVLVERKSGSRLFSRIRVYLNRVTVTLGASWRDCDFVFQVPTSSYSPTRIVLLDDLIYYVTLKSQFFFTLKINQSRVRIIKVKFRQCGPQPKNHASLRKNTSFYFYYYNYSNS